VEGFGATGPLICLNSPQRSPITQPSTTLSPEMRNTAMPPQLIAFPRWRQAEYSPQMRACIGEAGHNLVALGHHVFHLIVEVREGGADGGHVALKTDYPLDRDAQGAPKFHIGSNQFVGGVQVPRVPEVFIVAADDVFILPVHRCLQRALPNAHCRRETFPLQDWPQLAARQGR